jgi:multicomponent Na+:H+ antiporter subunit G
MSFLTALFVLGGAFFCLVAAIGVLRLPDLYSRMHAATKAGAFGAALMLVAAAIHFGNIRGVVMACGIILFFYLTAPVAAQALARAAYRRNTKMWEGTKVDQLAESGECQPVPLNDN